MRFLCASRKAVCTDTRPALFALRLSQYISLGSRKFGGPISIVFWARVDTLPGYNQLLDFGSAGSSNSPDYVFLIGLAHGAPNLFYLCGTAASGSSVSASFPATVTLGMWMHWAVTVDARGYATGYLNGVPAATTAGVCGVPITTRTNLMLGKSWWADPMLKGAIGDVQIMEYVLAPSEIASMYGGLGCAVESFTPRASCWHDA